MRFFFGWAANVNFLCIGLFLLGIVAAVMLNVWHTMAFFHIICLHSPKISSFCLPIFSFSPMHRSLLCHGLARWVPRACALSSLDLGSRLESIVAAFSREKSLAPSESCWIDRRSYVSKHWKPFDSCDGEHVNILCCSAFCGIQKQKCIRLILLLLKMSLLFLLL